MLMLNIQLEEDELTKSHPTLQADGDSWETAYVSMTMLGCLALCMPTLVWCSVAL